MIREFKRQLNLYFLFTPKTKKLKEFKEELLGVLMEKYEDLVASGMQSDRAFEICIDSIEDYKETIAHISLEKSNDLTSAERKLVFMGGMTFFAFIALVYFVVSIIIGWEYTWLTWIGGIVVALIGIGFWLLRKAQRNSRYIIARCAIPIIIFLMTTLIYLIVSLSLDKYWAVTWIAFICALPIWYGWDIIYRIKHKKAGFKVFDWMVLTLFGAAIVFLAVSYATGMWQYTWVTFIGWIFVAFVGLFIKKIVDYTKINKMD